ncbi:MAG: TetR/AcrR family transcriptional regulator [Lachnospiraceae bacterium]|nr:TetR/AcrR family transcriptional regulator [Lachnospiraceae bacterium]
MRTTARRESKKIEIMEKSFACYCENGLSETGIKALAKACDMTAPNFYSYFDNLDQLIIEATEHCMTKIEIEFMEHAPKSGDEVFDFIDTMTEWCAEKYGPQYRFMYQVYTTPKYLEYGKQFYKNTLERFKRYAKELEPKLDIPWQIIISIVIVFSQTVIQYAIYEEKSYLDIQKHMLKQMVRSIMRDNKGLRFPGEKIVTAGPNSLGIPGGTIV